MDWKLLVAVVLFVFGLAGFSIYQSANGTTDVVKADSECRGDSCDVVDLSFLEETQEETQTQVQSTGVTHNVSSLQGVTELLVNEGDRVELKLDAQDPDGDKLYYTFSKPFDEDGVWQSSNGEAGTYAVSVSVTDGEFVVSKNFSLVVAAVNIPPAIKSLSDTRSTVALMETDVLTIAAEGYDDDGDEITYTWLLDTKVISEEKTLTYETTYEDAGRRMLQLVLSDGKDETTKKWVVKIDQTNREPVIDTDEKVEASETGTVSLKVETSDPDGDSVTLTYPIPFDQNGEWKTDYSSAGTHKITLEASDGKSVTKKTIEVTISNKNRLPVVKGLESVTVYEGQTARAVFEVSDPDGDKVDVSFGKPLGEDGSWLTGFEDAGDYTSAIKFSDGKDTVDQDLKMKVVNVNRAPEIYPLEDLEVTETDLVKIKAMTADPDGDTVTLAFGAPLDEDGMWQTDYSSAGVYTVEVTASDGKDSKTTSFVLTVSNKNRPPQIFGVTN